MLKGSSSWLGHTMWIVFIQIAHGDQIAMALLPVASPHRDHDPVMATGCVRRSRLLKLKLTLASTARNTGSPSWVARAVMFCRRAIATVSSSGKGSEYRLPSAIDVSVTE